MTVEVEPIAQNHAGGFHAVLDTVARERRYLSLLEAPPIERTNAFISRMISENYPLYVALDGEHVVGWCDIMPKAGAMFSHCGVLGMGLNLPYRGQGLGRRLAEASMRHAASRSISRIELTVFTDNAPAIHLYRSLGFEIEGTLRRDAFVDGEFRDAHIMAHIGA